MPWLAMRALLTPQLGGALQGRLLLAPWITGLRLSAQVLDMVVCLLAHGRASSQSGVQEDESGRMRHERRIVALIKEGKEELDVCALKEEEGFVTLPLAAKAKGSVSGVDVGVPELLLASSCA